MWRRASPQLQALTRFQSPPRSLRSGIGAAFHSSSPAPFRRTSSLLSEASGSPLLKKKVEDVMPIATGLEREEIEAELEGKQRFDMDAPEGPFGTKTRAKARLANPQPKIQAVKGGMSGGFFIGHTGIGTYPRFGRGFPRGRFFPGRAAFQRGRGLNLHGRGRGGRFPYVPDSMESSYSEFRGRRPIGVRGGRSAASARGGALNRGRGRAFPPRRQSFAPEEDYGTPYNARPVGEDPYLYSEDSYLYGGGGHGVKRPFDMMERDPGYLELRSRLRPRYEHPDSVTDRYRGTLGTSGLYSRDYYGSDYGGSTYSSLYGDEHTGTGYYY